METNRKELRSASLALAAALALFVPNVSRAYTHVRDFDQEEQRDGNGNITVERAIIHVLNCDGDGENRRQAYIYEFLDRDPDQAIYRAILPPDWGRAIGGHDLYNFEYAGTLACTQR